MKRLSSPITDHDPSTKKQKPADKGLSNDESKLEDASVQISTLTEVPTNQLDCLIDCQVSNKGPCSNEGKLEDASVQISTLTEVPTNQLDCLIDSQVSNKGPCCGNEGKLEDASIQISTLTAVPSNQMDCLMDNLASNNKDIPAVMMIRSNSFEAHLQLIKEKFGELRTKNAGIFVKLFTDNNDMHQELISLLTANNIGYLTLKGGWFKVVIKGLPCDMKTQQIKEALIEEDLDVLNIVQMRDYRTQKSLPLFQVVLRDSDRNTKIFNLTSLLYFNISVGRIIRDKSQRSTIKCGVEHALEESRQRPEADIPKSVNCGEAGQVTSSGCHEKSRQVTSSGCYEKSRQVSFSNQKNFQKELQLKDSNMVKHCANLAQTKISHYHRNSRKELPPMNNDMVMCYPNLALAKTIPYQKYYQKEFPRMESDMVKHYANAAQTKIPHHLKNSQKELPHMDSGMVMRDPNLAQEKTTCYQKNYPKGLPRMNSDMVTNDTNMTQVKTTRNQKNYHQELPHMNSNISETTTDLQDIVYIMKEFRKLFGKFNDTKTFAQKLRNAKTSVEKFELFCAVFLD